MKERLLFSPNSTPTPERKIILVEEEPQTQEERLAALFAGPLNHGVKAVLAGFVLEETPKTAQQIKQRFEELTGGIWQQQEHCYAHYCQKSLIPIGRVGKKEILASGAFYQETGFSLTPFGKKMQPAINFFLKSLEEIQDEFNLEFSLGTLLGPTYSPSKIRAPFNRARILLALLGVTAITDAELNRKVGIDAAGVMKHLISLKEIRLANYESVSTRSPGQIFYRWQRGRKAQEAQPFYERPTLSKKVAELMVESQRVSAEEIRQKLVERDEIYRSRNPRALRNDIVSIVSALVKQSLVQREKFKGGERLSEVSLTSAGKRVAQEIILPLWEICEPTEGFSSSLYAEMSQASRLSMESLIEAVRKEKDHSPFHHKRSSKQRLAQVISFLAQNPQGTRPIELARKLALSNDYTNALLRVGLETGQLVRGKKDHQTIYNLR